MILDIDLLVRLSASGKARIAQHSGGGAALEVHQDKGLRWIYVGDRSLLSVMNIAAPNQLVLNYQITMLLGTLYGNALDRVLDLGLGGGSFVRFFKHSFPRSSLVSVDRSTALIDVARQYFNLPEDYPVAVTDAENYLAHNSLMFDLVLCDLFDGEKHSPLLEQKTFYAELDRSISPDGVLAINLLPKDDADLLAILLAIRCFFSEVLLFDMEGSGNLVLIASRQPIPSDELFFSRAEALANHTGLDFQESLANMQRLPLGSGSLEVKY